MSRTSAAQLAELLRRIADQLDAAGAELGETDLSGHLYLLPSSRKPEHENVLTIHTLSRHLGLPADRVKSYGSWDFVATNAPAAGGLSLRASTSIADPPQRYACGQSCTHGATGTTRAA
jgi:hypothetical protein